MKPITSSLSDFYQNIIYAFREKEKTVTSSASPVMLPRLDDARKIGNSQFFWDYEPIDKLVNLEEMEHMEQILRIL